MNVATILAAGRGTRFGSELPKQFVGALGKPVLGWTLEVFQRSPEIDAIQVVCQPEYRDRVIGIVRDSRIDKLRWITPGGSSCPESIKSAVLALEGALSGDDIALLHMGVSPLVSPGDIARAAAVCREKGCCFTMHPVNVCLARRDGEGWTQTDAPKEDFVELNTPWAFRYGDLLALYRRQGPLSPRDYTLGLWLREGRRAWYVPGDPPGRLKITDAHDLEVFEALLLRERGKLK